MKLPLQLTFRDIPHSDAVEAVVIKKSEKLDRIYDQLMGCRVVIESPHRKRNHGNLYHTRIDITVPGDEIIVGRDPAANHAHEDVYSSVNDAFRAAERQLKSWVSKRRDARRVPDRA